MDKSVSCTLETSKPAGGYLAGLTGFHLEHDAARKTSKCSWDFGVIALKLGHHKAQQLQMHNYNLTRLQLEPCCNLEMELASTGNGTGKYE